MEPNDQAGQYPRVTAVVSSPEGGRRLTLDPVKTYSVPLKVWSVADPPITAGFQVEWGSVETPDGALDLNVGAGMGSRFGTIHWGDRHFVFDANDLINSFVNTIRDADREEEI